MTDMETLMRLRLDGFFYTVSAAGCLGCRIVEPDWTPDYEKMIQSPHPSQLLSDEERTHKFHRQWSQEEDETLRTMAAAGKSTREMAEALVRSIEAVQKRRKALKCSRSKTKTKGDKFFWTDAMRADAVKMHRTGYKIAEIAERFGCSYRSASHAIEYAKRNWKDAA